MILIPIYQKNTPSELEARNKLWVREESGDIKIYVYIAGQWISVKAEGSAIITDDQMKQILDAVDVYIQAFESSVNTKIDNLNVLVDSKVNKVQGYSLSKNDFTDVLLNKLNSLSNYDDTALKGLIDTKVDKVSGYGLSKNDFTDILLLKLNGLNNYDDTDIRSLISNKVDKEAGFGLSSNDYTSAEKTKLAGLSNYDDTAIKALIPTKTSQLSIDSGFITAAVTALTNFYTKAEVTDMITSATGVNIQIVSALPATGSSNIIYFVPKAAAETDNVYDEYMWINSKFEIIGSTVVNMSDYYTKAVTDSTFLKKANISSWALQSVKPSYTTSEVSEGTNLYFTNSRAVNALSSTLSGYSPISHTHNYLSTLTVGTVSYSVSSNGITIPAYPTTLPASDVSQWAKATTKPSYTTSEVTEETNLYFTNARAISALGTTLADYYKITDADTKFLAKTSISSWALQSVKPSYSYSEISGTPTLATVATSGNYNDLTNKPSTSNPGSLVVNRSGVAVDTYNPTGVTKTIDLSIPVITIGNTVTQYQISPNVFYRFVSATNTLNIILSNSTSSTYLNEYMFEFTVSTLPAGINIVYEGGSTSPKFINSDFTLKAGNTYQVSIVNSLAVLGGA